MDFKKTLIEKKWFKISDFTNDKKDKEEVELVYPETCLDFIKERKDIIKNSQSESESQEKLLPLVSKYLIKDIKNFTYDKKKIDFSVKNVTQLLKSVEFRFLVYGILFDSKNFQDDIGFDFGETVKN